MHTLVASSTRGRYALDDPEGWDISIGDAIAIWLGGQWIEGGVEHTGGLYADESTDKALRGYYFESSTGGTCGLCVGMRVKLLE
jgi:Domain of unknown function (DUF5348)